MLSNILTGLENMFTLQNFLMMNLGLFVGIVIGALPGLTATMGVALILPMTFGMEPVNGIVMLLGVYCGGIYGGSITAILINTPGTPASAATSWDGYPLAKTGRAGQALDMAVTASTLGGLLSAFMLLFFAPIIARAALKFGAPEMFALCFFGLSIISSLCSEDLGKGLSMAGLGLFAASIGLDPIGGLPRFTFGIRGLSSGINLVTALIGLFAISEIFNKIRDINLKMEKLTDDVAGTVPAKVVWQCMPTIMKGGMIGTIIGAIPGTGAVIASFLSYNEAKRASKHPEEFGKGSLEGLAASESGNNGVTGATLIPLLTLGVPGDSVTAILLGAFMMQGLTPGPLLFTTNAATVYTIIVSLFAVNIFMLIQGKLLVRVFSNVTKIPMQLLIPILLTLCITGTFAIRNTVFDVRVMLIFGVVGYIAIRFKYPVTPMLLAFVLGPMTEKFLRQALVVSKGSISIFFTRPISLAFLILAALSMVLAIRTNSKAKKRNAAAGESEAGG